MVSEQSRRFKNCKSQLVTPEKYGSPHGNQDRILRTFRGAYQGLKAEHWFPGAAVTGAWVLASTAEKSSLTDKVSTTLILSGGL